MINKFVDSVISKGAIALLPHNLSQEWLDILSIACRDFICDITDNENIDERTPIDIFESQESSILLITVTEIIQAQKNYPADFNADDIPDTDMVSFLKCYAMSIIYERICRQSDIVFSSPDLENIFDEYRLIEIEEANPSLTDALYDFMIQGNLSDDN